MADLKQNINEVSGEEKKRFNFQCESGSLQNYFRQLQTASEPLTSEQERELWENIDRADQEIRSVLCSCGFVLKKHIDFLTNCAQSAITDYFPLSSLGDFDDKKNIGTVLPDLKRWCGEIQVLYTELETAFQNGKNQKAAALRKKAVKLLSRYPVSREKINEWTEYLLMAFHGYQFSGSEMIPGTQKSLSEELLCSPVSFQKSLECVEKSFQMMNDYLQQMVTRNLRLVVSLANHAHGSNVQVSDMIQEGNLGLMRAISKFDYKLGHKFSTYATWWIKQAVNYAITSQSRVIRLPAHMIATIARINRAEQNYLQRHGTMPDEAAIAAELDLTKERVSAIQKMAKQAISLQAPLPDTEEKIALDNLLSNGVSGNPVYKAVTMHFSEQLERAIRSLSEREQQVIRMRYGLDTGKTKTLLEVSKVFGLSRERIRQIELSAIRKMRNPELESSYLEMCFDQ